MSEMTLRHRADGWHYGIQHDDVDIDDVGGLLDDAEPLDELIKANGVRKVDVREDEPAPAGEIDEIVDIIGRKARSVVRYAEPQPATTEE